MRGLLVGIPVAVAAAGLYGVGLALQAREARAVPAHHSLRPSLLRRLLARPRFVLGTLAGLAAWGAQLVALLYLPVTVVRPVLAAGLVLLVALAARLLGEPVGSREVLAVLAMIVGVAGVGWAAPPHVASHASGSALAVALGAVGAGALLPYAFAGGRRCPDAFVAAAAGLAYAWDGLATKFAADDLAHRAVLGLALWVVAVNVAAGLGMLSEMSALQRRRAAEVAPIVFAASTLVPVLLAPALAGEVWSGDPLVRTTLLGSFGLILGAAVAVARSPGAAAVLCAGALPSTAADGDGAALRSYLQRRMRPV